MYADLIGNLGADAVIRNTAEGKEFLTFSIAENVRRNGEIVAIWYDITTNSVQLSEYLKKGAKVHILGDYQNELIRTKTGGLIVANRVNALRIKIVNFANVEIPSVQTPQAPQQKIEKVENVTELPPMETDDLPF